MQDKIFKAHIKGISGVLKFRALNLADEQWIQETYPNQGENAELDLGSFAHVLYRQLVDKSPYSEIESTTIDDHGRESVVKTGGYKLFMSKISGDEGKIQLLEIFTAVCKMSRPNIEEKNSVALKKKKRKNQLIFIVSFISLLSITTGIIALFKS